MSRIKKKYHGKLLEDRLLDEVIGLFTLLLGRTQGENEVNRFIKEKHKTSLKI